MSSNPTKELGYGRIIKYKGFTINVRKEQRYPLQKNKPFYAGNAYKNHFRVKIKYHKGGSVEDTVTTNFEYNGKTSVITISKLKRKINEQIKCSMRKMELLDIIEDIVKSESITIIAKNNKKIKSIILKKKFW